jgi:hypothetical protein
MGGKRGLVIERGNGWKQVERGEGILWSLGWDIGIGVGVLSL